MRDTLYDVGIIGLGVMGMNIALNMADHGYAVLGYDRKEAKALAFSQTPGNIRIKGVSSVKNFVKGLKRPRKIMMLVPAGGPVDDVIDAFTPFMEPGDILIDGGNSFYTDTDRRISRVEEKSLHFMGVGISGGEQGARFGPSIMPGGRPEAYEAVGPIFEKISAHVDNEPCAAYLGTGSAGHYTKMVHNGIEYALMQVISETFDVMRRILKLSDEEIHDVYGSWTESEVDSYLIEITHHIFGAKDDRSEGLLLNKIMDVAAQKGTGKWTSQNAMDLQIPVPTIDMGVTMRHISLYKSEREDLSKRISGPPCSFKDDKKKFINKIRNGLYISMIISYTQGMMMLKTASERFNYGLSLDKIAKIWRGGCIIRAKLLNHIAEVYEGNPHLSTLLMDNSFVDVLNSRLQDLRDVTAMSVLNGVPVPGFASVLMYIDAFRSIHLPANLIQAQRDYFGSHQFERIDSEGMFHYNWY
jgi:6-phosphogluconate dehydrogenase